MGIEKRGVWIAVWGMGSLCCACKFSPQARVDQTHTQAGGVGGVGPSSYQSLIDDIRRQQQLQQARQRQAEAQQAGGPVGDQGMRKSAPLPPSAVTQPSAVPRQATRQDFLQLGHKVAQPVKGMSRGGALPPESQAANGKWAGGQNATPSRPAAPLPMAGQWAAAPAPWARTPLAPMPLQNTVPPTAKGVPHVQNSYESVAQLLNALKEAHQKDPVTFEKKLIQHFTRLGEVDPKLAPKAMVFKSQVMNYIASAPTTARFDAAGVQLLASGAVPQGNGAPQFPLEALRYVVVPPWQQTADDVMMFCFKCWMSTPLVVQELLPFVHDIGLALDNSFKVFKGKIYPDEPQNKQQEFLRHAVDAGEFAGIGGHMLAYSPKGVLEMGLTGAADYAFSWAIPNYAVEKLKVQDKFAEHVWPLKKGFGREVGTFVGSAGTIIGLSLAMTATEKIADKFISEKLRERWKDALKHKLQTEGTLPENMSRQQVREYIRESFNETMGPAGKHREHVREKLLDYIVLGAKFEKGMFDHVADGLRTLVGAVPDAGENAPAKLNHREYAALKQMPLTVLRSYLGNVLPGAEVEAMAKRMQELTTQFERDHVSEFRDTFSSINRNREAVIQSLLDWSR